MRIAKARITQISWAVECQRRIPEATLLHGLELERISWLHRLYFAEDGSRWASHSRRRTSISSSSFSSPSAELETTFSCSLLETVTESYVHETGASEHSLFRECAALFARGVWLHVGTLGWIQSAGQAPNWDPETWWGILLESNSAVQAHFLQQRGFDVLPEFYQTHDKAVLTKNHEDVGCRTNLSELCYSTLWSLLNIHNEGAADFLSFLVEQSKTCPIHFNVNETLEDHSTLLAMSYDPEWQDHMSPCWCLLHKALTTFDAEDPRTLDLIRERRGSCDDAHLKFVKILVVNGADLHIKSEGTTPSDLVSVGGNFDQVNPKTAAWFRACVSARKEPSSS